MTDAPRYRALALQTACHSVNDCPDTASARSTIRAGIDRLHREITASVATSGADTRLVVLPEYVLTGPPRGESVPQWAERAALAVDGTEYARLGEVAADVGVYLSVNAYELDEHFPDLYFQACVIFDPAGEVVLRYRRLNSMWSVTPHDVLDRYLELYGPDSLFPVADTPIGRLAPMASEEILYPEVARCFAVRGAEVFVHNSSEVASALLSPKNIAKLARAVENSAYVVSANTAGLYGSGLPEMSGDGSSKVVDHRGLVLAEAASGASMAANAEIDLGGLRAFRRRVAMENVLARQRFELYAPTYAGTVVHPANQLDGVPSRQDFRATQQRVITDLVDRGVI
ncbi:MULTISPECIES: nitrilase-related carbon-nitrogen hydrolase [Mumia]|uniref:nitrilase-related carbon-nitrogen hydrolase n=1 Tax=Mumia TaxID=1546255 RepID=UPI00141DD8F8|nr:MULTISPECIES: nitrilase-related carbon-nitrogen hydrolase [unclassified Mumia]QMW66256.1 nitrilase [Mumia sp. ZJ1417]